MKRNQNKSVVLKVIIPILVIIVVIGSAYATFNFLGDDDTNDEAAVEESGSGAEETGNGGAQDEGAEDEGSSSEDSEGASSEPETSQITISTVGDIMVHDEQYWGAYDEGTDTYDFEPVFEHVKPYLEEADLAIGNFETTLAGEDRGYQGYPLFNSPDAIADALDYAGFDSIVTSNNHSLDMGEQGVERTVRQLNDRDFDVIGTYEKTPEDRHVINEVDGIEVAMLAFTESLNGMEAPYSETEVHNMVDTISEENLTEAIDAAKEDDPDIILTYMHWGPEYVEEPSEEQQAYAEFLADEGVDLIIGSHPHVLQRTEYIDSGDHEAFVAYSMGNFVSNQRVETIGEDFAPNEDGVIMNFDIEKDMESGETTLTGVDYTPTWVYRHSATGERPFDYDILPVEDFQDDDDLPDDILERLEQSMDRTDSRLDLGD